MDSDSDSSGERLIQEFEDHMAEFVHPLDPEEENADEQVREGAIYISGRQIEDAEDLASEARKRSRQRRH